MTLAITIPAEQPGETERWTLPEARSLEAVNAIVAAPLLERSSWRWRAW